ncbi:MAG: putative short-subunit dehydrogenase-like oxidoreductase (DUF2520 family) [Flavobacteriales bacterium]|jgi:predicted short-subunit dehydrogenase-like oxidoreductase (DUF2520 family)
MSAPHSIDIIGSGNVATQLAMALHSQGVVIEHIYVRNIERAALLAKTVNADTGTLDAVAEFGPLMILAVSDDAIQTVSLQLPKTRKTAHTSGAVPLNDLMQEKRAVFYPLQSFSKTKKADWSKLPILIESNDLGFGKELEQLGKLLTNNVQQLNSEQRKKLHVAAVMVNNFSNHLYFLAGELLKSSNLQLDLLKPLIEETAGKLESMSAYAAQTGPAKRKDIHTINEHLNLLSVYPEMQEIYAQLTESILKHHD